MAYTKTQVINGAFQTASGVPLSNGWVVFILSHDESVPLPASQVVAGVPVTIALDSNGNVAPGQYLWANDILTPNPSYYTVNAFNAQGLRVWQAPQYFVLTGPGPIDLGGVVPTNP